MLVLRLRPLALAFLLGASPAVCAQSTIGEIQGAAHVSPFAGQRVTTRGVITAIANSGGNGFWIQDGILGLPSDGRAETSDGLFVFTGTRVSSLGLGLGVGDHVSVTGTVFEFRPGCSSFPNNLTCAPTDSAWKNLTVTQLSNPTITRVSAGNPLPAPVQIGGPGGRTAPAAISHGFGGSVESPGYAYDPGRHALDFYESFEGMRVQVSSPQAVSGTRSFGEIVMLPDQRAGAALPNVRGGVTIGPGEFNSRRVHVDDRLIGLANMPVVPVGTTFQSITGVVDYSFANYKVLATANPVVAQASTIAPQVLPPTAHVPGRFTIAGYNVLNLAGNAATSRFNGIAGQIVTNLRAPDIVALSEIQDDNGANASGGSGAASTWANLISAIASAGGPAYAFRQIDPVPGADGGEPGGNIRVGFLYRPDRVTFVGKGAAGPTDATQVNPDGSVTLSPGRIDPTNPAFNDSRKPLVGEFLIGGERVLVVANHFNSKGGDDPLFGRFQDPVLASEPQRIAQANAVGSLVEAVLARDPGARIVVLGDLNDFEFSPPLARLKAAGLTNLNESLPAAERYGYIFDGNSQSLDHLLVSAPLARDAQFRIVHLNAEFPDATRISDHDAVYASLTLAPIPEPQTWALMAAGLGLVGWAARARRSTSGG